MLLITGGAGYIGSHCAALVLEQKKEIVIFDNLTTGHIETIETLKKLGRVHFVHGDLRNKKEIESVFEKYNIEAVLHFAASALIGESMKNPEKYYQNNVAGTLNLLSTMLKHNVKKIIFSSTAATYGEPDYIPFDESHPQKPINPYGQSKLMIEKIMDDYDRVYGLKSVRLRYFNAAGADSKCRLGEWHDEETHIIPNILKSALDSDRVFEMYGNDYDTKDGTCIRDYVNVEDLAQAHLLALEYLNNGGKTDFFNLGTRNGNSIKEIISLCEDIIGTKIRVKEMPRRGGDPAKLVADNKKAKEILNWEPKRSLKDSIISAYKWEHYLSKVRKSDN